MTLEFLLLLLWSAQLSAPHVLLLGMMNKYLVGSVLDVIHTKSEVQCTIFCQHKRGCRSVNFSQHFSVCELNHEDRYSAPQRFTQKKGYVYYDLTNYPFMQGHMCDNQAISLQNCKVPPSRSCKETLDKGMSFGSGMYSLHVGDSERGDVFCEMGSLGPCGGGGWTMVMKTDGSKPTFSFQSKLWEDKDVFMEEAAKGGIDNEETKLSSYWSVPFTKLCLGMRQHADSQVTWILLPFHASSLYDIIKDKRISTNTSLGSPKWLSLTNWRRLQNNCQWEGFNVGLDNQKHARARIGIIGNDQDDCLTCDSVLGFGLKGSTYCSGPVGVTCGADIKCTLAREHTKTMGYIFVQ